MTPCPYCARTCMGQCLGAREERTQERINKSRRWFTFGLAALAAGPRLPWATAAPAELILVDGVTIVPGYTERLYGTASGGWTIQALGSDGLWHNIANFAAYSEQWHKSLWQPKDGYPGGVVTVTGMGTGPAEDA